MNFCVQLSINNNEIYWERFNDEWIFNDMILMKEKVTSVM